MLTPSESARLRSDWAALKAERGTPITSDRLARLAPQHLTGPVSAHVAEIHDITERCRGKVRELIARRSQPEGAA